MPDLAIIRTTEPDGNGVVRHMFFCPGCKCCHGITTEGPNAPHWLWNGDRVLPSISPSILVRGTRDITDDEAQRILAGEDIKVYQTVCHSYVREGNIEFLGDCTHELAGNTVPLEPF